MIDSPIYDPYASERARASVYLQTLVQLFNYVVYIGERESGRARARAYVCCTNRMKPKIEFECKREHRRIDETQAHHWNDRRKTR